VRRTCCPDQRKRKLVPISTDCITHVPYLLPQIVFFLFGLCYGSSTFLTAATVYVSAYKEVPKGQCQTLVKLCAWVSCLCVCSQQQFSALGVIWFLWCRPWRHLCLPAASSTVLSCL
jgi:hypothetical protein